MYQKGCRYVCGMLQSYYRCHTCKFWIKVKLYFESLVGSDKAEFFSLIFIIFFFPYSVSPDTAVQAGIQSNCVTDYIFVSFFGSIHYENKFTKLV